MKFWLVCVVLLFFGSEATQWLGQMPWLSGVELSLPMTIFGGIGLAIASNYAVLSGRRQPGLETLLSREPSEAIAPQAVPPSSQAGDGLPTDPLVSSSAKPGAIASKGGSISFEIKQQPSGR
ncbi:hypothetical protein IQ254_19360 [Nodosilinea sp. LEGE 07088]|uniref:hypothetical protein n=1 Tax=Nodosilinea sp. LEGE 07088 TaxID=2777968 RepID=UPI00187DF9A2|nr:hypothetical protein [Nodosilinea sp. LEGE 07088]MBE9139329.1 hypothetical protein [Nodosilinea sp. LEGE 07088]